MDKSNANEALQLASLLYPQIETFKIGFELFYSEGQSITHLFNSMGYKIFLDLKLHDIPNTVAQASKVVTRMPISMFNVHTLGGFRMMEHSVLASTEEAMNIGKKRPLILGVTILTSINQPEMNEELKISGDISDQVIHLATMAEDAGLDGIIASPSDVEFIRRNLSKKMVIVTPGIRPIWAQTNDQKRTLTPLDAIQKGADFLVIGRPITNPPKNIGSSQDACDLILKEISKEKGVK